MNSYWSGGWPVIWRSAFRDARLPQSKAEQTLRHSEAGGSGHWPIFEAAIFALLLIECSAVTLCVFCSLPFIDVMSGCRVFIGRLNPAAREKDVERFFKGYGRIRDIDLKRGFGFVVSTIAPLVHRPVNDAGGKFSVCKVYYQSSLKLLNTMHFWFYFVHAYLNIRLEI